MEELMNINNESAREEEMYLLVGDIPTERMHIIERNADVNKKFDMKNNEEYIKSRFYFKSTCKDGSFIMNSIDENPYLNHYYFGYSEDETENFKQSFIGLREFLARASYVGRKFEPTIDFYIDTVYKDDTIRVEELDLLEKSHNPRLIVYVLGNKVLIKSPNITTSGFSFIETKDTPLVNEKHYRFVGQREDLAFTHDDIVNGVNADIQINIMANFTGPSFK